MNSAASHLPEMPSSVSSVFDRYPPAARKKLLSIRRLILQTAAKTPGVGPLTETLKWGEPAFLAEQTKSGSTIRIDFKDGSPGHIAIYFNCNTSLVGAFRRQFDGHFIFEGNRAIVLPLTERMPEKLLGEIIAQALTYHLRRRKG